MKNVFNPENITQCATLLKSTWSPFDNDAFLELALLELEQRELKQRADQICQALVATLPSNYLDALTILLNTLTPVEDNQEIGGMDTDHNGVAGWMILPFSQYVGEQGQDHLPESLAALKQMTKRFSSEFGIRYFFLKHESAALNIVMDWTADGCHHVRRLVSEGCRPLLPWAMQLPEFKHSPDKIIPLLEILKFDSSEYVRRSVANNLNDISKHHPDIVAKIAAQWLQQAPTHLQKQTLKMVKHACRTLIKQAHPEALAVFGFGDSRELTAELDISPKILLFGENLTLEAVLSNPTDTPQKVLVDFVIHHQKANGKTTPKVFKWGEYELLPGMSRTLKKSHGIKPITTRKYYSGVHLVELQVNGRRLSPAQFELKM